VRANAGTLRLGVVPGVRLAEFEGQYYTAEPFHYEFWAECLGVFDEVVILAQAAHARQPPPGSVVGGPHVNVVPLPSARGTMGYLAAVASMARATQQALPSADVWLLHPPSVETLLCTVHLQRRRRPYAVELRGDQSLDVAYLRAKGVPLPRAVSLVMRSTLRRAVRGARAVSAVADFLIKEHAEGFGGPVFCASDVRIPEWWVGSPRSWPGPGRRILALGRLEAQKDPLGLVAACAELAAAGFDQWELSFVGDGPLGPPVARLARQLGVGEKVALSGPVSWGPRLFARLREADLVVLNSVVEGMPRVAVEAMAAGTPVLGTRVGALPELLAEGAIVPRLLPSALGQAIRTLLSDPSALTRLSAHGIAMAGRFSASRLRAIRREFLVAVRAMAEDASDPSVSRAP